MTVDEGLNLQRNGSGWQGSRMGVMNTSIVLSKDSWRVMVKLRLYDSLGLINGVDFVAQEAWSHSLDRRPDNWSSTLGR